MSASGLLSHWSLAQAFKLSDTTFVMPLQFTKLIWASLIGLFFFQKNQIYGHGLGELLYLFQLYILHIGKPLKARTQNPIQVDRAIIN